MKKIELKIFSASNNRGVVPNLNQEEIQFFCRFSSIWRTAAFVPYCTRVLPYRRKFYRKKWENVMVGCGTMTFFDKNR